MNYTQTIQYLYSLGHETLAIKLGLETVRMLARACQEPQRKYPAIHIAGTNGKGSTAAMMEAILRAAGFHAGLFTSPHLVSITERIRVSGVEITQNDFARLASEVRVTSERLIAEGLFEYPPTFFEQVTMIAFLYLAQHKVDMAVLEVGLGGRLDATNICQPVVTAITQIGYDHQKYLGDTLAEIAGEKAGIIKREVPVVIAPQEEEAMKVIVARAAELNAPITLIEEKMRSSRLLSADAEDPKTTLQTGRYRVRYRTDHAEYDFLLSLRGKHQVTNALTAIHLAEKLVERGRKIPAAAVIEGLSETEWPGRLEIVEMSKSSAPLLLDGAHNAAGATALRDFLIEHFSSRPITFIFGAMADKAFAEMSEILFPVARKIIVTKVTNPRAAEPARIAEGAVKFVRKVECIEDVKEALNKALSLTPQDGLICCYGSLFLVGEIKEQLSLNGAR
jgi:dihydrofolate synthase/folylpolyglutamate synthase